MKTKELYKLHIDLDGVLADLDAFLINQLGFGFSGEDKKRDNLVWRGFYKLQDEGKPTFSALDYTPGGLTLWNAVKHLKPNILTATGNRHELATKEKLDWVNRMLPNYGEFIAVKSSRDKAQYATPTSILVDDREKSIGPWTAAGGIGVLYTSAESAIEQLKTLGVI